MLYTTATFNWATARVSYQTSLIVSKKNTQCQIDAKFALAADGGFSFASHSVTADMLDDAAVTMNCYMTHTARVLDSLQQNQLYYRKVCILLAVPTACVIITPNCGLCDWSRSYRTFSNTDISAA